ncbi:uncharacterized protein MELLADRAFT_113908 [Melampsora larici-populina 98AG31]|uniref:Uncharacterized protein n=1 Tax=Melampsora larici-populina (strain 98AG31 / pathotype 3-4-7) TaxID=747676 RepID=F4SBF2_MELLP|nr:uncharacterized protein MELLADRAFT_113908 [Melampsora larici-populina 98AG31]EGF98027.1 hypothetical protein MELLADRAFT_113908 [Melampsora larici-populina 98AG31]
MESSTSTINDPSTTTTTATTSTIEHLGAITANPPTEPNQTTIISSTKEAGLSTSTEQQDATITTSQPESYTVIPPPPREGTFKTVDDVEAHLTAHARANQYEITNLDVRKNLFSTWKCALGPNRKQIRAKKAAEALGNKLEIPTCPFAMTVKRDPVTDTWYIKIEDNKHNHGPILDLKIDHDAPLPDKPNSKSVPAPKESNAPLSTLSAIPERYQALISNLQELDDATEQRLLAVFVRDCQLAKNITEPVINKVRPVINKQSSTTTAGPSHSQLKSTVETAQEAKLHEPPKDQLKSTVETEQEPKLDEQPKDQEEQANEEQKIEEEENVTIDDNDSDDIPTTLLIEKQKEAKTSDTQTNNSSKTTSEAPLEEATGTENVISRPPTRKSTRVNSFTDSIAPPKKKSKKNRKSHSNSTPPHTGTSTPNEIKFPNHENAEVLTGVIKVCHISL